MAPPSNSPAYNVDWIVSNNSNVHVCNNLAWFTHYTPFRTQLGSIYSGDSNGMEGLGVGDVILETRIRRTRNGNLPTHRTLLLRDVVYAPSAICNILAQQFFRFERQSGNEAVLYEAQTGARMAMLDATNMLLKVLLKGQRFGQTSLDPEGVYVINATWHEDRRTRWEEERRWIDNAVPPPSYDDSTTESRPQGNNSHTPASSQSPSSDTGANPPAYTGNQMTLEQKRRHQAKDALPVSRPMAMT